MQSAVPTLPVVCSDGHKRSTREPDVDARSSRVDVKNSLCKGSSCLAPNRKQLHPLVGGPYRNSMRLYALSEPVRSTKKSTVGQRVTSAKMLRVKQLQNQLTDAHYHLNELANENRLLKALQKRQDSALKRYEGTNAELPRIINSHHEELKVLQTKYKKLRTQHKRTCDVLKEKENEIHSLQSQNKHLIQLSKDRHLEERDKLQMRVSDLNFRIEQQQETIQTLNRKLALESKSLKHQLNVEVAKHKETQKHLHETLDKLKNLEDLLDNREKRLYYSGRLPVCNKGKAAASQSLMNLGNNSVSTNPPKSGGKCRGQQNDIETGSLPKLIRTESNDGRSIPNLKIDSVEASAVTETMSSLQQVRKFRLQKSYSRNGSAGLANDNEKSDDDEEAAPRRETSGLAKLSSFEKLRAKRAAMNGRESEDEDAKRIVDDLEIANDKGPYKLPKQLMREFGYSSSESDNEAGARNDASFEHESASLTNKSRELHNRLIGGNATFSDAKQSKQKSSASTSESESASEKQTKNATRKSSYSAVLRSESPGADGDQSRLSVDDFLKLDINATDSDLEMERLRKARTDQSEKSLDHPFDDFSSERYESSQRRLMTITKSWTELQEKIKKEREISESQLKALNDSGSIDASLFESKFNDIDDIIDTTNPRQASFDDENEKHEREDTERRRNEAGDRSVDARVEIPHEQQNGVVNDPRIDEKEKNPDIATPKRFAKESRTTEKTVDETTSQSARNLETETNGIAKKDIEESSADGKLINYNKQKLLAAMKAIDDNENIDFGSNQKHRVGNTSIRSQTTISDNLYRGLPSHARKKDDIMKELFGDAKAETKLRAGCSKIH